MDDVLTKRCRKCREVKPTSEFNRDASRRDGLVSWCRTCRCEAKRNRRDRLNPELAKRRADTAALAAIGQKRCTMCKAAKPFSEFSRAASHRDGLYSWCRACCSEVHSRRREAGLDRAAEAQRYAADPESAMRRSREYRAGLRAVIFAPEHFGPVCKCPGCGSTENLTIDHVNGGGEAHRQELFGLGGAGAGWRFYAWLIENDFPEGYQAMCAPCNLSKGEGQRCRIWHPQTLLAFYAKIAGEADQLRPDPGPQPGPDGLSGSGPPESHTRSGTTF